MDRWVGRGQNRQTGQASPPHAAVSLPMAWPVPLPHGTPSLGHHPSPGHLQSHPEWSVLTPRTPKKPLAVYTWTAREIFGKCRLVLVMALLKALCSSPCP